MLPLVFIWFLLGAVCVGLPFMFWYDDGRHKFTLKHKVMLTIAFGPLGVVVAIIAGFIQLAVMVYPKLFSLLEKP
jgi:hypothetical protein